MNHKALYICHICQKGEQLQIVDEALCLFLSTLDFKGKDRTAAVREVLLVKCLLLRVCGNRRMMYSFYLRMLIQIVYYLQSIFHMSFHSQGKSFQTLQEEKCMEGRNSCSRIS